DASDLPAPLAATGPFPLSVQELYDRWLWHGPALQAIASIDAYGPDGLDATLRASASGTGSWRLDPVVVDAVFQLGIVWSRQTLDRTALPARVGRVEGAISLPAGTPVRCRLRLTAQAGGGLLTGRAALLDPDDRPLAVLAGIELSCSADLNRLGTAGGPEAEGTAEAAPTADRPEAERTAEAAPTADRPEAERTAETAPTADRPEAERTAETAPTAEMAR
ncbi:MAG: polyketide synthase dehydratase domain-containing protein, partial [Solirubrobacterales bacterium]